MAVGRGPWNITPAWGTDNYRNVSTLVNTAHGIQIKNITQGSWTYTIQGLFHQEFKDWLALELQSILFKAFFSLKKNDSRTFSALKFTAVSRPASLQERCGNPDIRFIQDTAKKLWLQEKSVSLGAMKHALLWGNKLGNYNATLTKTSHFKPVQHVLIQANDNKKYNRWKSLT